MRNCKTKVVQNLKSKIYKEVSVPVIQVMKILSAISEATGLVSVSSRLSSLIQEASSVSVLINWRGVVGFKPCGCKRYREK